MSSETRYFKCIYNGDKECGRQSARTPKQAANKAFTAIIKDNGNDISKSFKFTLRECTRGTKTQKERKYQGSRIKLNSPREVTVKNLDGNRTIKYEYMNKVKYLSAK